MNLNALIELTNSRKAEDSSVRAARIAESRVRLRQYDQEIEKRIASQAVSQALLAKTCSL
ncbi:MULTISPECIES: hypothetical protein [Pseudomonas syringae group]|nr:MULTISPECIES: hypothetical protein [Pseudomonas syringae group]MDA3136527.1 hypothetical protein [Pseudomonas syringae]AVB21584.1 hypothetical protein BKM03_22000 [Pseudomonas avellanae]EGH13806.1 hypothetical protein PSYMP_25625 [Pseudomonas amygdali pv. morsprunorum str. M302280]KWS65763.1 hypothetical protein AL055_22995 [Pseudomonas amygdali pv. morsprunorum]PHN35492.1 hypothetical protein AO261_08590 [Pseudomonas avellanae]